MHAYTLKDASGNKYHLRADSGHLALVAARLKYPTVVFTLMGN